MLASRAGSTSATSAISSAVASAALAVASSMQSAAAGAWKATSAQELVPSAPRPTSKRSRLCRRAGRPLLQCGAGTRPHLCSSPARAAAASAPPPQTPSRPCRLSGLGARAGCAQAQRRQPLPAASPRGAPRCPGSLKALLYPRRGPGQSPCRAAGRRGCAPAVGAQGWAQKYRSGGGVAAGRW